MACDRQNTANSDQCHACLMEWLRGEDLPPLQPCRDCQIKHLRKNMCEKLDGHYCEDCAAKYEQRILSGIAS